MKKYLYAEPYAEGDPLVDAEIWRNRLIYAMELLSRGLPLAWDDNPFVLSKTKMFDVLYDFPDRQISTWTVYLHLFKNQARWDRLFVCDNRIEKMVKELARPSRDAAALERFGISSRITFAKAFPRVVRVASFEEALEVIG